MIKKVNSEIQITFEKSPIILSHHTGTGVGVGVSVHMPLVIRGPRCAHPSG